MLPRDRMGTPSSGSDSVAGSKAGTKADAPRDALLELVFEGVSYPCKNGTIIGTSSGFAKQAFSKVDGLEPRHLLLGTENGYWFALTPKSVRRPFRLEGKPLVRGERVILDKARYHVEFDDTRFGLRLSPRR
jgi:hypothetical protein